MPVRSLIPILFFLLAALTAPGQADNYSVRQHVIDSLEQKLKQDLPPESRAEALADLGQMMVEINLDDAAKYATEALDIYRRRKEPLGQGKSLYVLALVATDLGAFEKTDSLLREAEGHFEQTGSLYWKARISNAYGKLYFVQGNSWLAGENFLKAAQLYDSIADTVRMVRAYSNLVNTLGEARNYEQAIRTAHQLYPLILQVGDKVQEAYLWYGLILHYGHLGRFDSAARYLPRAQAFADTCADRYIGGYLYGVAGQHYMLQQRYAEAIPWFIKARDTFIKTGVQRAIAEYDVWLAHAYVKNGRYAEAKTLLDDGLKMAQLLKIEPVRVQAYQALSDYFSGLGQSDAAYTYLKQHLLLKDSIYSQETAQYNAYLESTFQKAQKEKQIAMLNLSNAQKEVALLQRNRWLIGGALGAAALIIILLLFYRNSRQRQVIAEKEKHLQQQQIGFLERQQQVIALQSMVNGQEAERSRIARDLHDGLGGLFSAIKMHFSSLKHQVPALEGNELFNKSLEMADTASIELRRIAHNMMPEVLLKMGLLQALNDLAQNMSSGKLLKVFVLAYGMDHRLPATTEVMLYRIVQELLNNIIKHAKASEAHVQLNREDNHLLMTIEDNGIGFDTGKAFEKSAGMQTIQQRVEYLNGKLSIESRQFEGTTVIVDVRL